MLIWSSRNISHLLKTVVLLNIFVKSIFFTELLDKWSFKEQYLFEIKIFCDINVYTATFASLLNQSIQFL